VFAEDLVEPLRRYVDWVKISAYDLPYTDLVQKAAGLGCPVVLSTAMATGDEIDAAIEAVWKTRGGLSPLPMTEKEGVITLLHGTAAYPAPLNQANLKAIETLLIEYPECRIGLSDHTLSAEAAMIATAMGAEFFEVHFRLDDSDPMTPDYANARTPLQFSQYVNTVYRAKEMLGSGDKIGPEWVEMPLFVAARRSNEKRLRG
jgi:sialic acid synthase SpsE